MEPEKDKIHETLRERREEERRYYDRGASDLPTLHNAQKCDDAKPADMHSWERAIKSNQYYSAVQTKRSFELKKKKFFTFRLRQKVFDILCAQQSTSWTLLEMTKGYQTLGQLFQEVKERNRILELELQKKQMISIATEMETKPETTGPQLPKDTCSSMSEKNKAITSEDDEDTNSVKNLSLESSSEKIHMSNAYSLPTENPEISESNLLLTKKLEDALRLVDEYGRKRSNDKKLVKILNEEVKKAKDELHSVMDKLGNAEQENKLMMKKIARLEKERDSIPLDIAAINTEVAEAEDWVHLHQETPPVDDKMYELQKKCEELKHKATRWENEHFNLQIEYTKHLSKCENSLKEEHTKNQKLMAKIKTLESNHEKVLHHNHLLMELQSKMSAGQISKPKYGYPNPITAASNENLLTPNMEWSCKQCTFTNSYQSEVCLICKAPKSPTRQATSKMSGRWKCSCCTYVNNYKADACAMCKSSRKSCQWEENEHLSKPQK
ncbi:unnamed protein product [Acanthosepion pharaonis]|uniref:RanBP2-type domain-containing protein n=1 Tax=Acanthosepion pharaonis TaxID=158019 RepID=A0A812BT22_ACAPH|nr:unnamed protein product [Sepia pharaonis]